MVNHPSIYKLLLLGTIQATSALAVPTSPTTLAQYAPQAASLFNNMKTPAAIIGGAVIPIGFLSPLPRPPQRNGTENKRKENIIASTLRKTYIFIAVTSLCSELISVTWATVAVNKLTETIVPPSESVWDLLRRDYDIHWSGTNTHFVVGLLGFMHMIGTRAYLMYGTERLSTPAAGMALSGLCLMLSIVNRGVSMGSGGGGECDSYGATVLALFRRYGVLLVRQATAWNSVGVLELCSVLLAVLSSIVGVRSLLLKDDNDDAK